MDEFLKLEIAGFAIQIAFIAAVFWILTSSSRASRKEAHDAKEAAQQAQADARKAQCQASMAADKLLHANSLVITNLTSIAEVGNATHTLVNSQRSELLGAITLLSQRIARENPSDATAQIAATTAAKESSASDVANALLKKELDVKKGQS